MRCLASATASSFRDARVRRVDRENRGRSARVEWTLTHHWDHCRLGKMSIAAIPVGFRGSHLSGPR
jgi:hypothetical protein